MILLQLQAGEDIIMSYQKRTVDAIVDYICKGCTFHIGQAMSKVLKRESKERRHQLEILIRNFFYESETEEILKENIKAILDFNPKLCPWYE